MAKTRTASSASAKIRAGLKHPVVDADGHFVESVPVLKEHFLDFAAQAGGSTMREKFKTAQDLLYTDRVARWTAMTWEQRRDAWTSRPAWWGVPSEPALDRASGFLPKLLAERLDDLGIDFAVLYPSIGVLLPQVEDEELRRIGCRAFNTLNAELYAPYADRLTPVAVIPTHTPQEAIDELEHAVKVLKLKAVTINGHLTRPIPWVQREHPELAGVAQRLDLLGLDSDYDYDPLWAKCVELGVCPASHSTEQGWGSRRSISNYIYNHIGAFSQAGETLCRALFMGGVTKRFPTLNFALLEGGVAYGCNLYVELIGHWEKRNGKAIQRLNPARLDVERMGQLIEQYGYPKLQAKKQEMLEALRRPEPEPVIVDEFARSGVEGPEDIRDAFVPRFFFGCEADDPMVSLAFNKKVLPMGARINAMFSSDIGHWDVPDMTEVLHEAHELVDHGLIDENDFRDFVFTNPVQFYAGTNPSFFKGTRCEAEAGKVLGVRG